MPQFDQGSFLNQVFWFFLVFLNSYFFITYFFLPLISKNLKFRKKKIITNNNNLVNIEFENIKQHIFYNDTFQNVSNYLNTSLKKINENLFNEVKPLKKNVYNNITFQNDIIKFYVNYSFYPKKFN